MPSPSSSTKLKTTKNQLKTTASTILSPKRKHFRFLDLPPELRLIVYTFHLSALEVPQGESTEWEGDDLALLKTNRLICKEVLPLFKKYLEDQRAVYKDRTAHLDFFQIIFSHDGDTLRRYEKALKKAEEMMSKEEGGN